jgi:RimJ/RimL family protein N-acetyltransferase
VTLRPPGPGDAAVLIAGRDAELHRWLGPGAPDPRPTACIVAGDEVVGWVDADPDHDWLGPGAVNVGYSVFAPHRRRGYATAAVELLLAQLAAGSTYRTASLLIDPANEASLGVALRAGFAPAGEVGDQRRFDRRLR